MSSTDDSQFSKSVSTGNTYWSDDPDPALSDAGEPMISTKPAKKQGSAIREIIETALIAVVIFVGVRTLVLNFRVDGSSMLPSLVNGEMLLVNRNAYKSWDLYTLVDWIPGVEHAEAKELTLFDGPNRGDVIVFNPPVTSEKPYIKRVIGLPGDTVEIKDGGVWVNGIELDETYLHGDTTDCQPRACDPVVVPEGSVFVLGDNRAHSSDSRYFGTVEISEIVGKAWITYWPIGHIGSVPSADYDELDETSG
ncbi:MAG: signal peptidase I [Thermomicrobiales bacterium]